MGCPAVIPGLQAEAGGALCVCGHLGLKVSSRTTRAVTQRNLVLEEEEEEEEEEEKEEEGKG